MAWAKYHIRLHPDSNPYPLLKARHIPIPLRPKVAEELARIEKAGVISKVTKPTPLCARMVVVQDNEKFKGIKKRYHDQPNTP